MNIIDYSGGKALLLTSDDLFIMNKRFNENNKLEQEIKTILDEKDVSHIIIITSFRLSSLPLWLRNYIDKDYSRHFNAYRGRII